MERSWFFAHLAVPADGHPDARMAELLATVVAGLVAAVRRADPPADWFFDPIIGPAGSRLRLGFHATRAGLDEVRRRLSVADRRSALDIDPYVVRDAARGGALAQAGSDVALALLGGGVPWLAGVELPLTVAHLRHLTGLVPAADQPAFLFLHWQDRSRLLTGARRRDLAARADAGAEKIVLTAGDLPLTAEIAAAWRRYLTRVADVAGRDQPTGATPRGFLLAHHAQLTHERWGISPDVDALAALALRLTMVRARPGATAPVPVSQRRQQPYAADPQ